MRNIEKNVNEGKRLIGKRQGLDLSPLEERAILERNKIERMESYLGASDEFAHCLEEAYAIGLAVGYRNGLRDGRERSTK